MVTLLAICFLAYYQPNGLELISAGPQLTLDLNSFEMKLQIYWHNRVSVRCRELFVALQTHFRRLLGLVEMG
jgi:hypothetical protein